jgi:hypothetical protein
MAAGGMKKGEAAGGTEKMAGGGMSKKGYPSGGAMKKGGAAGGKSKPSNPNY